MDLFELFGAPVFVVDPYDDSHPCRPLYANAATLDFFGADYLSELDFGEVSKEVVEAYRNIINPYKAGIDTSTRQLVGVRNATVAQGQSVPVTEWKCPLQLCDDEVGEPRWVLAILMVPDPITKHAEFGMHQANVALTYTASRFWTYNPSTGDMVWANAAAERDMLARGVSSMSLQDHLETTTGVNKVAIPTAIEKCLDPATVVGTPIFDVELEEQHVVEGSPTHITYDRCQGFKVRDRVTGRFLLLVQKEDITAENKSRSILEDTLAQLEQKGQFVAQVAHEIRTPLNGLLGFLQVLEEDTSLSPAQADMLEVAVSSGVALSQILSDVLDLSMHGSGQGLAVNNSTYPLVAVPKMVDDVVRLFGRAAHEKGLGLVVDYDPSLLSSDAFIVTDLNRMRQVVTNLLTNALKYTRQGNVCLRVASVEDGDGADRASSGWLQIDVEDTGIGIAPHKLEDIFRVYHRATDEPAAVTGSCGLGLSITQVLSTLLRGHVSVTSELGVGSTFSFIVPREPPMGYTEATTAEERSFVFDGGVLEAVNANLTLLSHTYRATLNELELGAVALLFVGPNTLGPSAMEFLEARGAVVTVVDNLGAAEKAVSAPGAPAYRAVFLEDNGTGESSIALDPIRWISSVHDAAAALRRALDAAAGKIRPRIAVLVPHLRMPHIVPFEEIDEIGTLPLLPSQLMNLLGTMVVSRRLSTNSGRGVPRRRASSVSFLGFGGAATPAAPPSPPSQRTHTHGSTNVLIVDDDSSNRRLLRRLVAKLLLDAHIDEAADGQAAVDAVCQRLGVDASGSGTWKRPAVTVSSPLAGARKSPSPSAVSSLMRHTAQPPPLPPAELPPPPPDSPASAPLPAPLSSEHSASSLPPVHPSPTMSPNMPPLTRTPSGNALLNPSGTSGWPPLDGSVRVGTTAAPVSRTRPASRSLVRSRSGPAPLVAATLSTSPTLVPRGEDALSPLPTGIASRRSSRDAPPFDLIFCDIEMPIMDGLDAVRSIRGVVASSPDHAHPLRVVALTGHSYEGFRTKCLEAGFDDIVSKPVVRKQLKEVLQRLVTPGKLHGSCVAPPTSGDDM